ncbi:MAG: hypothetical protein M3480_10920 [Verrucomicrobiota bacterium]|nr:hypothetical protein [Chthoniobacterales bacterium]MDQ3415460.1 hypothetical protein [Verrucomicrobiota bacterium]
MAEKPGPDETPIELRQKIVRSRELVVRDLSGIRFELDFPRKLRRAFQSNTVLWVGAALAIGLGLALLRARPQKIYVGGGGKKMASANKTLLGSGAILGLLKFGITLVQPMVVSYFAKQAAKKGGKEGGKEGGREGGAQGRASRW